MSRKAFTLIELLVVVAVLALLASIVFSNLGGAREGSRISNALSFQSQTHSLLGSDLVGWWNLDNNLNDQSGYGNHGTWEGGGSPNYVEGVPGTGRDAANFNGVNDYIHTGLGITTQDYTVSAWIFMHDDGSGYIVNQWISGDSGRFIITQGSGYNISVRHGSSVKTVVNNSPDTWFHVVVGRRYGNTLFYYVNSEENGTLVNTNPIADRTIQIGGTGRISDRNTATKVSDVRIYSRALTASEIQTLYAQTKDNYLANE